MKYDCKNINKIPYFNDYSPKNQISADFQGKVKVD